MTSAQHPHILVSCIAPLFVQVQQYGQINSITFDVSGCNFKGLESILNEICDQSKAFNVKIKGIRLCQFIFPIVFSGVGQNHFGGTINYRHSGVTVMIVSSSMDNKMEIVF